MILGGLIGNSSKIIPYSNSNIQWLGRWTDRATGMQTGWSGPQIVFKVRNTPYLIIVADTLDPDATAVEAITVDIDESTPASTVYNLSSAAATSNGNQSVKITIPDLGEHKITLKVAQLNAYCYAQTSKAIISQFIIDAQGEIVTWTQGSKVIQCVGDSWMGSQNDWPRLMDSTRYKLYPIASGGLTCANMDSQYNNDYNGVANTSDITADAVLVSFGVNDYNASVSQASFETSMGSLVDKIRTKQPNAPIYLIRVPNNVAESKLNGQYGTNMANVAAAKTNCFYIDTTSLDNTIEWGAGDIYHLSGNGKQTLANFVKAELIADGI